MAYTTDLTEPQFEVFDQFLPRSKTRGCVVSRRLIVNAILYQLKNGCQWRDLPQDYPNWQTVYSQFRRWKINGVWEQALVELEKIERAARGKKRISQFAARGLDVCEKH
jgi:putative transposase